MSGQRRITIIEGLRFAAALAVVIYHYLHVGGWGQLTNIYYAPVVDTIARYGYLGVDLFFIISGFVIFFSIRNSNWLDFAVKRYFRLAPSLILGAVITFTLVNYVFQDATLHRPASALLCSTLLPLPACELRRFGYVDPAYWSLTIEMIFYVLVAILLAVRGADNDRLVRGVFWAWVALSAAALLPAFESGPLFFVRYALALNYAGYFVAGAAMYKIWAGVRGYWPVMTAGLVVAAAQAVHAANRLSDIRGTTYEPGVVLAIVAVISAVMIGVATGRLRAEHRWLGTLGALTYPLYLLHEYVGFAVIRALTDRGMGGGWAALIALGAALVLAQGMVLTSERASKRLTRWYSARKRAAPLSTRTAP